MTAGCRPSEFSPPMSCTISGARAGALRPRRVAVPHLHHPLHRLHTPPPLPSPVARSPRRVICAGTRTAALQQGPAEKEAAQRSRGPRRRRRPSRPGASATGCSPGRWPTHGPGWCDPRVAADASASFHPRADRGGGATGSWPTGRCRLGRAHPPAGERWLHPLPHECTLP